MIRAHEGGMGMFFVENMPGGKPVTGAPFTATATTESTQVLADGNRIVNKSTASMARDSQGRTRREQTMGNVGPWAVNGPKMVFISDPVAQTEYVLNMNDESAEVLRPGKDAPPSGEVAHRFKVITTRPSGREEAQSENLKTESLGTQTIEGVTAEGKRLTRIIPAGQIGNERPLEITSETWTSPELQQIVLSKRNDPRVGETVYRLTDIKRGEPDPSLFKVPAGFSQRELPAPGKFNIPVPPPPPGV
jgi:hypothetical protein